MTGLFDNFNPSGNSRGTTNRTTNRGGNTFANAVQHTPEYSRTHNGGLTFKSSTDPVVDLFFLIGASRGKDITVPFEKALNYDSERTLRMLFYARDIRQGMGERQTFRSLMKFLEANYPLAAVRLIQLIPEYGRWDDILIFTSRATQEVAFDLIKTTLEGSNMSAKGLCAKWMPRKGVLAAKLRNHMGWTPKRWRKTLVNLTRVVETQMCAKQWDSIDYNKVPSVAAARYQKAFSKNDEVRYGAYREALSSKDPVVRSTAKINASAVYPHDVLKSIKMGDPAVAAAQWEALPDYTKGARILPVVDVSGSMGCRVGGNANLTCMDVSVSLGLYLADKQKGAFKDIVCTFSSDSRLEILRGDIRSKVRQLQGMHWGMSTNIEKAFHSILTMAVHNRVPSDEMPEMLLVISDMEFNSCAKGTAFETARRMYSKYGYDLPKVVFWNVNAREGNSPVTFRDNDTALVSGFSPTILKAVLGGRFERFTPQAIVDNAIMTPRYDAVAKRIDGVI